MTAHSPDRPRIREFGFSLPACAGTCFAAMAGVRDVGSIGMRLPEAAAFSADQIVNPDGINEGVQVS